MVITVFRRSWKGDWGDAAFVFSLPRASLALCWASRSPAAPVVSGAGLLQPLPSAPGEPCPGCYLPLGSRLGVSYQCARNSPFLRPLDAVSCAGSVPVSFPGSLRRRSHTFAFYGDDGPGEVSLLLPEAPGGFADARPAAWCEGHRLVSAAFAHRLTADRLRGSLGSLRSLRPLRALGAGAPR